jgi:lysophospholipase L1-like esterase
MHLHVLRRRRSRFPALILLFFLTALNSVAAPPPTSSGFLLQPRDTVVFLGDSITENGRYIGYLEEYLHNYHPGYQVRFINAGWGGDRITFGKKETGSPGALARLDRDVLAHHPTVVVVLLGMNDGRSTDPSRLQEFRQGMEQIIRRVRQRSHARLVLLSGTPYDTTRRRGEDPALGENVGRFAAAVRELGQKTGVMVVDTHGPLLRLVRECHERRPPAVLIPDGVHPTSAGHLMIASLLLRAWHASLTPRAVALSGQARVLRQDGCDLRACRRQGGALLFERRLAALPVAVGTSVRDILAADTTVQRLCADLLIVQHLPARRYELRVDGHSVGCLSRESLEQGADLSLLSGTPDTRQAREAADIAHYSWRLRHDAWLAEQGRLAVPITVSPPSLRRRIWDAILTRLGKPPAPAPTLILSPPPVPPDLDAHLARLGRAWRTAAVPKWHRFALTPL